MVDGQSQVAPANAAPTGNKGKRILAELLIGAAIGMGLTGAFGPGALSWWYQPPIKDAFSCASSVHAALQQFVWMQVVVAGSLAIAFMVGSFLIRRRFAKKA